ncbi:MAG: hypothetical protein ACM3W7_05555 [Acidobacteriota bacterium]
MAELRQRLTSWEMKRASEAAERARMAILRKTITNDPALLAPVRVRVLRPFYVGGKPMKIGDHITLARHDATSLAALKRVLLL